MFARATSRCRRNQDRERRRVSVASLLEHLAETMPFAAALSAMDANAVDIKKISAEEMKRFLRYILPGETYVAGVPQLDKKADPEVQGIWAGRTTQPSPHR